MQHLKPAICPLTAPGDLIKNKGRGQFGQLVLYPLPPHRDRFVGQSPCAGQVNTERLHHIEIPPLRQQCLLQRQHPNQAKRHPPRPTRPWAAHRKLQIESMT